MDTKAELIGKIDWRAATLRLVNHADMLIRQRIWRGERASTSTKTIALADGGDAEDYVHKAIESVVDPASKRKWDLEKQPDLERHLMSVLDSMISNASRLAANRDTRRQFVSGPTLEEPIDRIADAPHPCRNAGAEIQHAEIVALEKDVLDQLRKNVAQDPELAKLLDAYEAGIVKNQEIEELYDLSAERVSELKRKMRQRIEGINPHVKQLMQEGVQS